MTLEQIKAAVLSGKPVHWSSSSYSVTVDNKGQFFISCVNGSRVGLTWLDGKTLNGKESEFFLGVQS